MYTYIYVCVCVCVCVCVLRKLKKNDVIQSEEFEIWITLFFNFSVFLHIIGYLSIIYFHIYIYIYIFIKCFNQYIYIYIYICIYILKCKKEYTQMIHFVLALLGLSELVGMMLRFRNYAWPQSPSSESFTRQKVFFVRIYIYGYEEKS